MITQLSEHAAREELSETARRQREARRDAERAHRRQVERVRASLLLAPRECRDVTWEA